MTQQSITTQVPNTIINNKLQISTLKNTNYFGQNTYKRQFITTFLNQGIAVILVKTLLAPLQRYRIIKQTQSAYPLRPIKFKGFINYLQRIPKQQGFLAFWRGNGANCTLYLTQIFMQIGFYDNLKSFAKMIQSQYIQKNSTEQDFTSSLMKFTINRVLLPFSASFFTLLFTYPIDTARVRLSMSYHRTKSQANFSSVRTCISDIKLHQRFRYVYKGFLLSNFISFAHFNLFLETSKLFSNLFEREILEETNKSLDFSQKISRNLNVSGWLSAILLTGLLHPFDTLRRMIQLNNQSRPALFTNTRQLISYLKQNSSIWSVYNGFTISLAKTMILSPLYALTLTSKNQIQKQEFSFGIFKSINNEKKQNQNKI